MFEVQVIDGKTTSFPRAQQLEQRHRHYVVYGQRLCSDLPLRELPRDQFQVRDIEFRTAHDNGAGGLLDAPARLLTRRSTNLDCDLSVYATSLDSGGGSTGYLLRWEGRCDFQVSADGDQIVCQAAPGTALGWVTASLYGIVLSFALHLKGVGNLHASSVVLPGGAVGFLAQPGSGKSTLAASFAQAGYSFLTDDVLALSEEGESINALPGFPFVSLNAQEVEYIWRGASPVDRLPLNQEKCRIQLNGSAEAFCAEAVPLKGIYLLERGEETSAVEISRLSLKEAIPRLLEETNALPLLPRETLSRHFAFVSRLVSRVPVWRLSYPSGLGHLKQVNDTVLAHHGQNNLAGRSNSRA